MRGFGIAAFPIFARAVVQFQLPLLREALDLDSMDIFNIVVALSQRLGVDIPDIDAGKLTMIGGGIDYLARRLAEGPAKQPR